MVTSIKTPSKYVKWKDMTEPYNEGPLPERPSKIPKASSSKQLSNGHTPKPIPVSSRTWNNTPLTQGWDIVKHRTVHMKVDGLSTGEPGVSTRNVDSSTTCIIS